MNPEAPCTSCGGTQDVQPVAFLVPNEKPRERKPLIDPLWHREWLKGTAGATLLFGGLVFLGPTVVLPASLGKPVEFGPLVLTSLFFALAQGVAGLLVLTDSPYLNKRIYTVAMTGALAASLFLGFGDVANVVLFGVAGGFMLFVRVFNTLALGFATFAATAVKQIPLD